MSLLFAFLRIAFAKGALEPGSGVFTMTFTSTEIVHLSLCYIQWPSFVASSLHQSCVFHPHPYNFTIHPEYPTKIGRPLKKIQSDHISVSINITDTKGVSHGSILETISVDRNLPSHSVSAHTDVLNVDFEFKCDENFFGPRCSRYCKVSSVDNHHFVCARTGEKICLSHWTGPDCSKDFPLFDSTSLYNTVASRNRVISRSVRTGDNLAKVHSVKHHYDRGMVILLVAASLLTTLIGCALYLMKPRQLVNVQVANVVTF